MAGHHSGAVLLEDTHPEEVEWMPALFPGVPGTALSAAVGLCLGAAGAQLPENPSLDQLHGGGGGCGSGRFQRDECLLRVSRAKGGHLVPAAWQSPQMEPSVPPHPTGQAADAVPAGHVPGWE